MNNSNLGTQMEVKNLLLKALVVSAIGCFGSVGMYYQRVLSIEMNRKINADKAYKAELTDHYFRSYYYQNYVNGVDTEIDRINNVLVKSMRAEGYKDSEILSIMQEARSAGFDQSLELKSIIKQCEE